MARSHVKAVTAYVDLGLKKRPSEEFHALGRRLVCASMPHVRVFRDFPFSECWVPQEFNWIVSAANPRAEDRFATDDEHVCSNMIQHSPMQWLRLAAEEDPEPDVFVWIGYSVMKQGAFTGRPVAEAHVSNFLRRLEDWTPDCIPIPAINPGQPVAPHGDNWQYVGSTVIAPRRFLPIMDWHYRFHMRNFALKYRAIPLDLAIWPTVVEKSGLPWRAYPAEYDHTQFTNF